MKMVTFWKNYSTNALQVVIENGMICINVRWVGINMNKENVEPFYKVVVYLHEVQRNWHGHRLNSAKQIPIYHLYAKTKA